MDLVVGHKIISRVNKMKTLLKSSLDGNVNKLLSVAIFGSPHVGSHMDASDSKWWFPRYGNIRSSGLEAKNLFNVEFGDETVPIIIDL